MVQKIKSKKLEFGDVIGIITPSEPVSILKKDRFEKGIAELKTRGQNQNWRVRFTKYQ